MFYQLPPVGNPIILAGDPGQQDSLQALAGDAGVYLYQSGSAALAAAVIAAAKARTTGKPEVILPAYGCPDLVSAVVHAGARPVLVDLAPERPWLDLAGVEAALNNDTVAVIAASLCGLPERLDQLRLLTEPAGVTLIEDSAQYVPGRGEPVGWKGDLVVLSFGRGKPVNLLGGGALLCRQPALAAGLPRLPDPAPSGCLAYRIKAQLYNRLTSPRLYWLLGLLPFLHIGETRYHPLLALDAMDSCRRAWLAPNVRAYRARVSAVQAGIARLLGQLPPGVVEDLAVTCGAGRGRRLLRYPVLLSAGTRDRVLGQLVTRGLGASSMYPATLPLIEGLQALLAAQGPFPQAQAFAARLLTLPTHAGVRPADMDAMEAVLQAVARGKIT